MFHGIVGFDEEAEAFHNFRTAKEFTEEVDFFPKFFVRDGLDKFLGGHARFRIEFGDLLRHRTGNLQSVTFAGKMSDQAGLVRGFGLNGAAREEQIADKTVPDVAPEPGNTAKAGNETQAEFWKAETRHFV